MPGIWASRLLTVFAVISLSGCGDLRTDDPAIDLDLFPHVLDMVSLGTPDLVRLETRLINFGTPESHEFLTSGWADEGVFENDGSTFCWSLGEGSTLRFTSFEQRRQTLTARLRPYRIDGPAQKIDIKLNDQPVVVLPLKGGMRTYQFKLPAGALRHGDNELTLSNIYPRKIAPGPPDLGPPGVAWDYLRFESGQEIGQPEVDGDAILLPFGAEMRFFAELTDQTVFSLERLGSSHRRGSLDIHLRVDGDEEELVHQVRASTQALNWHLGAALGLDASQPALVEISLWSVGGPRARDGQAMRLHRPQLRSAIEMITPRLASDEGPTPADQGQHTGERPNVLIYLVDTLRADHLGCYGYERETSPRINAFAADAIVFDHAYANSSWTRSTVASLFTGRLPASHGVHGRKDALTEEAATLAEVLRQGGYTTAAMITNPNVGHQFGLGQGFDVLNLLKPQKQQGRSHHVLSDSVHRAAVDWLDQPRKQPFFLYLHTIDPHAPYVSPEGARQQPPTLRVPTLDAGVADKLVDIRRLVAELSPEPVKSGSLTWMHALQGGFVEVTDDVVDDLLSLYDAEVLFNDFYFGQLIDYLKKTDLYENTIVVFVSDHGEEFHDHQGWTHGRTLYQEQIRMPLIVRFPKGPHGLRLRAVAQQIDLLPTLADVLDLPIPNGIQGESLWPGISAEHETGLEPDAARPRVVYSQLELDGISAESLVRGRFKLICTHSQSLTHGQPAGCRLFDLAADPGETVDLALQRPVLLGYLRQWLRTFEPGESGLKASPAEENVEVDKHLRALGYL